MFSYLIVLKMVPDAHSLPYVISVNCKITIRNYLVSNLLCTESSFEVYSAEICYLVCIQAYKRQ